MQRTTRELLKDILNEQEKIKTERQLSNNFYLYFNLIDKNDSTAKLGDKIKKIKLVKGSPAKNELSIYNAISIRTFDIIAERLKNKIEPKKTNLENHFKENTIIDKYFPDFVKESKPIIEQQQTEIPLQQSQTQQTEIPIEQEAQPQMQQPQQAPQPQPQPQQPEKKQEEKPQEPKSANDLFSNYNQIILSVAKENEANINDIIQGEVGIWIKQLGNNLQYAIINAAGGKNPVFNPPEPKENLLNALNKAQTEIQDYIIKTGRDSDKT